MRLVLRSSTLSAVLLAGCASAPSQHVYVAPTQETVFSSAEETQSGPGQILYVTNRSSVPVTVYSFTLRDCENVRQTCAPRTMNIHIDAGNRAEVGRVQPSAPDKAFAFRWSFAWRADSAMTAALGALASAGSSSAREQLDATQRAELQRRHEVGAQDVDLTNSDLAALSDQASVIRLLPDSIVLRVGQRTTLDTVHALLIGTNNQILGRVRSFQWRLAPGAVTLARPDTIVATTLGRTALQLKRIDAVLPMKPELHATLQIPSIVR